jgi:hypothetical protein
VYLLFVSTYYNIAVIHADSTQGYAPLKLGLLSVAGKSLWWTNAKIIAVGSQNFASEFILSLATRSSVRVNNDLHCKNIAPTFSILLVISYISAAPSKAENWHSLDH